jgi:hypothetical protein
MNGYHLLKKNHIQEISIFFRLVFHLPTSSDELTFNVFDGGGGGGATGGTTDGPSFLLLSSSI